MKDVQWTGLSVMTGVVLIQHLLSGIGLTSEASGASLLVDGNKRSSST